MLCAVIFTGVATRSGAVYSYTERRQQRIKTHNKSLENVQCFIHSGREGPRRVQRNVGTEAGISRSTINVTPTEIKTASWKEHNFMLLLSVARASLWPLTLHRLANVGEMQSSHNFVIIPPTRASTIKTLNHITVVLLVSDGSQSVWFISKTTATTRMPGSTCWTNVSEVLITQQRYLHYIHSLNNRVNRVTKYP